MTTGGWIMMIVSLAAVWGMAIWSYRKVLSSPSEKKVPPGLGP